MIQFLAGMLMGWILSHQAVRDKLAQLAAAVRAKMGSK